MELPAVETGRYEPCDVLVAGGGMAGITAATAAARAGAKTVLVEKAGWLGGMGITGATGLHTFYNIFQDTPGAERQRVVSGLPQELVDRTAKLGGGVGHVLMERGGDFVSMLTPVEPETFKLAAVTMCLEAGVTVLLHSVVDAVRTESGHVESIVVWNKSGRSLIAAKQFVDATGDGDLAGWAGAPFERFGPNDHGAYPAGFTFRLCNLDLARAAEDLESRGLVSQIAHAVKPGTSRPDIVRLGINMGKMRESGVEDAPHYFFACSLRPREFTYCNCINYGPNDGLDAQALSAAETDLRGKMFGIADLFRKHVAGCEQCYPAGPAPSAGQRRGRAIRCEYELSQEDCVEGRRFPDQIAVFSFIDNGRFSVKSAGAYGIPYRSLVPRGLDNVLIAGRMMSVDLVAHNSTRNTACCMACGQAAGTAAALAVSRGIAPGKLDAREVREELKRNGALLEPVPEPLRRAG